MSRGAAVLMLFLVCGAAPAGERLVDPRRGWELLLPAGWEQATPEAPPPELALLLRGPRGAVAVITRIEGPSPEDPAQVTQALESRIAGAVPGYRRLSVKRIPYGRGEDQVIAHELTYRTQDTAVVARFMAYRSAVVGIAAATPGRSVGPAARRLVAAFRPVH